MASDPFFSALLLWGLLWLWVMLHYAWLARDQRTSTPTMPPRKRSGKPPPFPGLTHKPPGAAWEQAAREPATPPPPAPPPLSTSHRGRPRPGDTPQHSCPNPDWASYGRVGYGNLHANGHPSGGPWRQWPCTACKGSFLETHGTPLDGKHVAPDVLVWSGGALAEGLGIRAVARVFQVDPKTVLAWWGEAADHLQAFSQRFLHDIRVTQVQLDEIYALLRAGKDGTVSEAAALTRLARSPRWSWVAFDPVSKLIVTLDVGDRTLAMAQRVVHQGVQVVGPGCLPLFRTDGLQAYTTAWLTHYGQWIPPTRPPTTGPVPTPRWMPRPQRLYAQVRKVTRQRRLVRVTPRVVFGALAAIEQGLAAPG